MRRRTLIVVMAVSAALAPVVATTAVAGAAPAEAAQQGQERAADRQGGGHIFDEGDDDSEVPDPRGDGDNLHPSGRDRHEAHAQGRSRSAPDEDGHGPERDAGGTDKSGDPDGPGGLDLSDQDGNNGCGNDDDFEDDNEGWCGKPEASTEGSPGPSGSVADSGATSAAVLDSVVARPERAAETPTFSVLSAGAAQPVDVAPETGVEPRVLGAVFERSAAGGLAATGSGGLVPLMLSAFVLVSIGGLMVRLRRAG